MSKAQTKKATNHANSKLQYDASVMLVMYWLRFCLLLNFGSNLHAALSYLYNYALYASCILEVQKYCTVSRNRWIAIIPGKLS